MMNGKGSKRRPTDERQYAENYDRIFGSKKKPKAPDDVRDRPFPNMVTNEAGQWVEDDEVPEEDWPEGG